MKDLVPFVDELSRQVQLGWLLLCTMLVLFMQAGFGCIEAGAVRHKNSINVAMKNMVDYCVAIAVYFIFGYTLMYGEDILGLLGTPALFLRDLDAQGLAGFLRQAVFCGTAATIVAGATAERCRLFPYVLVSAGISAIIYPLYGHWVWGGGWLEQRGFHDFGGASVVHVVGGGVSLAGIRVLGARTGRFGPAGEVRPFPASNMPLMAVGVCILMFGWMGYNGGSAALSTHTAMIVTNTLLAACFGCLTVLLALWTSGNLATVHLILNGTVGGLVAVTAGCDVVTPTGAAVLGMLGGLTVLLGSMVLDKLRFDDAVGAVPVHYMAGIVGLLGTALLGSGNALPGLATRLEFLCIQALGAAMCGMWSYVAGLLLWLSVGEITRLRVTPKEEEIGLNYTEHQVRDITYDIIHAVTMANQGDPHPLQRLEARDSDSAVLIQALQELVAKATLQSSPLTQSSADTQTPRATL